jgi:hypothetical protein
MELKSIYANFLFYAFVKKMKIVHTTCGTEKVFRSPVAGGEIDQWVANHYLECGN